MDFVIKYWVEVFFALIVSGVAFGYKEINKRMQENDCKQAATERAVQGLLRERLLELCHNAITKGSRSIELSDNIKTLYELYHTLGGNGTVTEFLEQVKALPIEQKEE